jgi:hypothetical protein
MGSMLAPTPAEPPAPAPVPADEWVPAMEGNTEVSRSPPVASAPVMCENLTHVAEPAPGERRSVEDADAAVEAV